MDEDAKPTEGPSKKARRERENDHFVGGTRNPAKAVARLHVLCETGKDIRRLWTRFVKDHPKVMETASNYGGEHCELDMDALEAWRTEIERFLEVKEFDDVVLRLPGRFASPLNAKLWEG